MRKLAMALVCAASILMSCTSAAPPAPAQAPASAPATAAPSAPKTLHLGILQKEPSSGIALFSSGCAGCREPAYALHAGLTVYDDKGALQPRLATKIPSIQDKDWTVAPDGTMEVTWKLKPNLTWQDGSPLTADDFIFGMQVYQDKDVPLMQLNQIKLISSVTAPDPQTVVVHWSQTYPGANVGGIFELPAVPRHIIGDLYAKGDKQAFTNSTYWAHDFVGVGPYKLGQWLSGSYIEALAYDNYVLGRPKIDRLIFDYYGDVNALTAALLGGQDDISPVGSLELENAEVIKQAWDPIAGGAILTLPNHFHHVELNRRNPVFPWEGDVRVRQAMASMLDRQSYVDSLMYGLSTVAEIPLAPDDPAVPAIKALGVDKYPYPYDLAKAQQLLSDAGWNKGADGLERNAAGSTFSVLFVGTGALDSVDGREALIVVDQWKAGGLDAAPEILSADDVNLDMKRATEQGGGARGSVVDPSSMFQTFTTAQSATMQNRWRGSNRPGYSNPAFDQLFDQWNVTLDTNQRNDQVAQMVKLLADDVAYLSLYYSPDVVAIRKGVQGAGNTTPAQVVNTWNVNTWDIS